MFCFKARNTTLIKARIFNGHQNGETLQRRRRRYMRRSVNHDIFEAAIKRSPCLCRYRLTVWNMAAAGM